MPTLSSSADVDISSSDSLPSGPPTSSTGPSSVTSEPPVASGSPGFAALDDLPTPKLRLESSSDEKLASREPEAPVPSDFPGKKQERFAHIVTKGDFESDNHFYPRCRKSTLHHPFRFSS